MAVEEGINEYTQDGTVDLKGNPVLRSKRGGWTACYFVIAYEVFERLAYYGVSSTLVLYLTNRLHLGTVKSANYVTNWVGTSLITPIVGAYIADAHLGRYWTFVIASVIYFSGMCLLTLAVSVPGMKPPHCTEANVADCEKAGTLQLALFFGALYTLAVGTGGTMPNIATIGADQFDDFKPKEKAHKLSFFNWWMFGISVGTLVATMFLVYVPVKVGWPLGYGLSSIALIISIVTFLAGTSLYRHRKPTGSPFARMARVIVAALRKRGVPIPSDPKDLYELDMEYTKNGKFRIDSTPSLRFLNKASVKTGSNGPWMLCSVTQVEETKQMFRMIPILIATFIPSMTIAQINTLFIRQGTTLDRGVGSISIHPTNLVAFAVISRLVCIFLYDRCFVKIMRKWTKNPRGITHFQRMGIGLVFHIIVMTAAALIENGRLIMARDHGLVENEGQVPLTIFILLPQFVLMGMADAFLEIAKIEFFYDQAPASMKSLGTSYYMTSLGIGNFLSGFLLSTVAHITKEHGHHGWVLNNLNASHLDYYYALLAILSFLNFIFFLVMTKLYVYKAEVLDSMEVLQTEMRGMTNGVTGQKESGT